MNPKPKFINEINLYLLLRCQTKKSKYLKSNSWSNVPQAVPVVEEKIDNINSALKHVIKKSQNYNGKWLKYSVFVTRSFRSC